jgi:citronellyl-CoA dehydrogenase
MAIGVQTDMATPALARFGADELCREFLPPSIAGDYVACLGVSEVGAGSDVASIETTARKVGGDYAINGGKMWTTNGIQADWMCLLADTGDGPVHRNKSLICVPMRAKAGGLHERNQHQPGLWRCAPWLDRRGRR